MNSKIIQHPKVVVIGAGSLFFGRQSIWQMVSSPYLRNGTLALVDIDKTRLEKMVALGKLVAKHMKVPLKVEGSTDRKDVLEGADYIVLSFSDKQVMYRGIDCAISEKYGIRMCSGDTFGPGGIFRALHELPVIMECARDIEAICPDAWIINYINPSAVNGIALRRYAPKLKSFALCDSLHHIKRKYAVWGNIISDENAYTEDIEKQFDFRIAGVNHFTWLLKAEYKGRDVAVDIAEHLRKDAAARNESNEPWTLHRYDSAQAYELYRIFGYIPTCIGHTKEYVRFWQGNGKTEDADIPPLAIWKPEFRNSRDVDMWKQIDDFISGATPISEYMNIFKPDPAADIIENMVGRLGKTFFVNTFNNGAVTNLRDDAFLELLCEFTSGDPKPLPVGEMPLGLRGMQELVLDTHELTVQAIIERDYALLRRAMMTDPLTCSISDTDAIIRDLMGFAGIESLRLTVD